MNFLFHYMARWKAVNWTRYHEIFVNLAKMGHTVHILQAPPVGNSQETNFKEIQVELPPNLHLHDVEVNPRLWNAAVPLKKLFNKGYYTCRSVGTVKRMIRQHNIDVLFVYNIPQYPLIGIDGCLKVFDIADDYIAMLQKELGRLNNPAVLKAGQSLLNSMVKKSDLALVVSDVLKNCVPEHLRAKLQLLPNGVNIRDFTPNNGSSEIRQRYPGPVIGFIGSFEYFIDFQLILEVAGRMPHCTFLMVGAGREFPAVQRHVRENSLRNVILTGPVPHQEIAQYIGAMDICLNIFKPIPISHGACPIKLFEYLAMKKPVISTRLKEVERIDKGFLAYADSAQETCEAIERLLADKIYASRIAQRGNAVVTTEYDWPLLVEKLLTMLRTKARR